MLVVPVVSVSDALPAGVSVTVPRPATVARELLNIVAALETPMAADVNSTGLQSPVSALDAATACDGNRGVEMSNVSACDTATAPPGINSGVERRNASALPNPILADGNRCGVRNPVVATPCAVADDVNSTGPPNPVTAMASPVACDVNSGVVRSMVALTPAPEAVDVSSGVVMSATVALPAALAALVSLGVVRSALVAVVAPVAALLSRGVEASTLAAVAAPVADDVNVTGVEVGPSPRVMSPAMVVHWPTPERTTRLLAAIGPPYYVMVSESVPAGMVGGVLLVSMTCDGVSDHQSMFPPVGASQ